MTTMPHPANQSFVVPDEPLPERRRFNPRLWLFVGIISLPFLWIVGSAVYDSMTGGIKDRGSFKEVDLKLLGNFTFNDEAGSLQDIPPRYRALDGQRVALRGYMYGPEEAGDKGREFQFVYNVSKCCFSGPPLVQERVFVHAKKDIPIYDQYTFAEVTGILHVRLKKVGNKVVSVYDLDAETAKDVQG